MAKKFVIRCQNPELVVPAKPTPHEIKLLSDIDDQQGLRYHYPSIMFYKENPTMKGKDPVRVIKEALAKALVYYYPYAGRLVEGPNKKLMVNCTAEGIVFAEASAEVRIEQLQDMMQPPCPCSEEFLLDIPGSSGMVGCPLMSIQVTRLQCGGFVFAVRLSHMISDGSGKVQFLNAVSQMAKGQSSPSPLPVWNRELLLARNPPLSSFVHKEFKAVANDDKGSDEVYWEPETLTRQSFFFGPKEIKAIKNQLPPYFQSRSKFELITAYMWWLRTKALELGENEAVILTFFLNIRGKFFQELPNGYYGNAVVSTAAVTNAKTLCNNPLSYAMELLSKAKEKVNQDYVKSAIDFLALHGKPGFVNSRGAWVVSDASRVGYHEIDFGWGNPIYGGTMDGGPFYFTSLYTQVAGNVGVWVPICLPVSAMDRLKEEMRKLTHQVPVEEFRQPKYIRALSML